MSFLVMDNFMLFSKLCEHPANALRNACFSWAVEFGWAGIRERWPQAADRFAIDRKKKVLGFNQCSLKQASLLLFSKTVWANAGETWGAPDWRDEREFSC